MKLPDALAPYAILLKWLLIAGLLLAVYVYGRGDGKDAQAREDAALIAFKNQALQASALAHAQSALRFREISAATDAAEKESEAWKNLAADMAKEAGKDKSALVEQISALNAAAERERETCSQAEMQICGSPLL